MLQTKICYKCKRELSTDYFNKDKNKNDGFGSYCQNCLREYRKIHKGNPDSYKNLYGQHKIENGVEYKFCSTCHSWLTLDKFQKRKDSRDGLRDQCKHCRDIGYKNWANNNVERNKRYTRITHKICTKCKQDKDISEFYECLTNPDGFSYWCKNCKTQYKLDNAEHIRRTSEVYRNKPEVKERMRTYMLIYGAVEEHRQATIQRSREHYRNNTKLYRQYYKDNRDKILLRNKEYGKRYRSSDKYKSQENIEKRRLYQRMWHRNHPGDKISNSMSRGIYNSLKNAKNKQHWEDLVPYNLSQLKRHIERQFSLEMNWGNYGTYWEIDHIIPQNLFNISTHNDMDFKICWSLKNLRPLTVSENRSRPKDGSDISINVKNYITGGILKY